MCLAWTLGADQNLVKGSKHLQKWQPVNHCRKEGLWFVIAFTKTPAHHGTAWGVVCSTETLGTPVFTSHRLGVRSYCFLVAIITLSCWSGIGPAPSGTRSVWQPRTLRPGGSQTCFGGRGCAVRSANGRGSEAQS